MTAVFRYEDRVRDYELDMQGIVNNGVYFNYLEHARHEFLLHRGVDFAELARQHINLVVVRCEIDYRASLTSGDRYAVEVSFEALGRIKLGFRQRVIRLSDDKVCVDALVVGTALSEKGRPMPLSTLDGLLD